MGNARHYGPRKTVNPFCPSAASSKGRHELPSHCCLYCPLGCFCHWLICWENPLKPWVGLGYESSRVDWELQFWVLFSQWLFFLPWCLLPARALCLLLLWKLSLLLSMALWKEVLHLKELTCPQDFFSRWVYWWQGTAFLVISFPIMNELLLLSVAMGYTTLRGQRELKERQTFLSSSPAFCSPWCFKGLCKSISV